MLLKFAGEISGLIKIKFSHAVFLSTHIFELSLVGQVDFIREAIKRLIIHTRPARINAFQVSFFDLTILSRRS